MNIKLPTGFISDRQLSIWQKSKTDYVRQYFYKEFSGGESYARILGRKIADWLQTGDISDAGEKGEEVLRQLLTPGEPEVPFYGILAPEVPAKGILDNATVGIRQIVEYKAGKTPWTAERVAAHSQLKFYAALVYTTLGHIPDMVLQWAETEEKSIFEQEEALTEDFNPVQFTGRVETFDATPSLPDVLEYRERAIETAHQISRAYLAFRGELPVNRDLLAQYAAANHSLKIAEAEAERLRKAVDKELTACGVDYLDMDGDLGGTFSYSMVPKFEFTEAVTHLEGELKALKDRQKKTLVPTYERRLTFRPARATSQKINASQYE